jgi:dTDP-4-amino-4,6-dideoxygalactose transaminase
MGFKAGYCKEAERYHKDVLSIPMYPKLSTTQQDVVIKSIKAALQ